MGWKEVEFGGSDSAERVKRLQAFCAHPEGAPTPGAFDAILIIGGVDSYHADVAQAVFKYLLLGSSGQELLGEQVISQEHDRLEDVVLVITRQRISIFYSSESDAAVKVLPMISQWRNVTEYTIHDGMEPDEQEACKIAAFKSMVSGLKRIGIPYGVDAKTGKDLQDRMIPEKWPLIQSYGLEDGKNGKGFFTMNHDVVNISSLLRREMAKLDDFNAKRIVQEVEPLLTHHYDQFLLKLDHAETPSVRDTKSEVDMAEDLLSFYDFGTTQYEARGLAIAPHRGSRVLFGKRSSVVATKSSSSALLSNSGGVNGQPATHMLVQTEDPFSGVRFTRTYFLSTGKIAKRIVDEDALVHSQASELADKADQDKASTTVDTKLLIELYVLLLRGYQAAIKRLVQEHGEKELDSLPQCITAAKTYAMQVMHEYSRSTSHVLQDHTLPASFFDDHFVINVECLDACGQETRFPAPKWNLLYVSLEFKHVPSQITPTASLGSVIVGDTILFKTHTTSSLNITRAFPYFRSWIQSGREAASAKALLSVLQSEFMLQSPALQLGRPLTPLDISMDDGNADAADPTNAASSIAPGNATGSLSSLGLSRAVLLLECEELPMLKGSMQLFSGGFCFKTPHLNPIVLSFARHVTSFRVVSTPYEELVLLQMDLKEDTATHQTAIATALPFVLATRSIAFPLLAGTRFQEEIVRALATWKTTAEALEIPFYRPHDLTSFDGLTPRDGSGSTELAPIIARTCEQMVRKPRTSNEPLVDKFFPRWFIPKDSNPTTTLPKPKADRSKLTVPITVTLGLPGSDVVTIAKHICEISSGANDWMHVHVDTREAPQQSRGKLERYVTTHVGTAINTAIQRIHHSVGDLPPRIMLSVVGYVDPMTITAAIKDTLSTKISTVIGCVSALNAYLPDPLHAQCPLPKLFDQLTAGFTTHVVLTHSSEVPSSTLGRLRYHIDQVNPFADIQVLTSDVFAGPITSLLAIDRFESAYYKNYRDTLFPEWERCASDYVAELEPAMSPMSVCFEVAPGLERARFLAAVSKSLTPYAVPTKSLDKIHPTDGKGIRLAQSIATGKVLQNQQVSSTVANEAYGDVWCVEATLSFAGDAGTVYEYVSTGSYARLRVVSKSNDSTAKPASGETLRVKITGCDLDGDKIQALIVGCYATLDGAVQPLRNQVQITLEEKREIQKKHALDPLPDDYFFDGTSYVDTFGRRYEFHPNIKQYVDEHVASLNAKAEANNAKVEENRKSQHAYVKRL